MAPLKTPFVLSLSKDDLLQGLEFPGLPFMVRQAHHERREFVEVPIRV
jgi:hypothetical protein